VLSPEVINLIKDDHTSWELEPLSNLVRDNQLFAFKHNGFWQPMDTLREKKKLNELWDKGSAPWKIWK
jgi:glucose-1-phosphate cytidylyltransferase